MLSSDLGFYVYLWQEDGSRLKDGVIARCKIGWTSKLDTTFNNDRLQGIRSCSPELLFLRHTIATPSKNDALAVEGYLHRHFSNKRSFNYYSEWFDLSEGDIRWLCSLTFESIKAEVSQVIQRNLKIGAEI